MQIALNTQTILLAFLALSVAVTIVAILLAVWVLLKVRRIRLATDASVFDALRAAPLSVVIILDLLDLGLDVFSAPFTWMLLSRLGLSPLRGVAVAKDLIPFADVVPAMTLGWVGVRVYDRSRFSSGRDLAQLDRSRDFRINRPS